MFHLTTGPRQDSDNVPAHRAPAPPPTRERLCHAGSLHLFFLPSADIDPSRHLCAHSRYFSLHALVFHPPFLHPPIPLPVTDCKLFGINVLKAGFVFVFMQMFSELDPTFLSFGKELPCGQQLGITSYAEVMVKLWYLRTSVCDYSLYGGKFLLEQT